MEKNAPEPSPVLTPLILLEGSIRIPLSLMKPPPFQSRVSGFKNLDFLLHYHGGKMPGIRQDLYFLSKDIVTLTENYRQKRARNPFQSERSGWKGGEMSCIPDAHRSRRRLFMA
ncbi:MAG TPA: hypothetical protein PK545_02070 [Deltaproteobacteria bacterium]|nr:hypothetical protein [Deltaproteobacteria bacterium]